MSGSIPDEIDDGAAAAISIEGQQIDLDNARVARIDGSSEEVRVVGEPTTSGMGKLTEHLGEGGKDGTLTVGGTEYNVTARVSKAAPHADIAIEFSGSDTGD